MRSLAAQIGASTPGPNNPAPSHRGRVQEADGNEGITIGPAKIEVCSDDQWQRAIELLADLLAPAYLQRIDDMAA